MCLSPDAVFGHFGTFNNDSLGEYSNPFCNWVLDIRIEFLWPSILNLPRSSSPMIDVTRGLTPIVPIAENHSRHNGRERYPDESFAPILPKKVF